VAALSKARKKLKPSAFIELNEKWVEILATSLLNAKHYPASIFPGLYRQRWGHEEG